MQIILLRDSKPGHFHQAEGLGQVIARMGSADIRRLDARPLPWAGRSVRRDLVARFPNRPKTLLLALYGIGPRAIGRPDLIIGAGESTVGAGILLSRATGAKLVLSGTTGGYDEAEVALVFVESPRSARPFTHVFTPMPCAIEPATLPAPRPLRDVADLRGAIVSLLVGGRATGFDYSEADWRSLEHLLVSAAHRFGVRWRVSTSRRTPRFLTPIFAKLLKLGVIEQFIDFRSTGAGSADSLYAADAIVVTADSRSMEAEALAARRPVVLLSPSTMGASPGQDRIAANIKAGTVIALPLAEVTAEALAEAIVSVRVSDTDPREEIAAALRPLLDALSSPAQASPC